MFCWKIDVKPTSVCSSQATADRQSSRNGSTCARARRSRATSDSVWRHVFTSTSSTYSVSASGRGPCSASANSQSPANAVYGTVEVSQRYSSTPTRSA